MKVLLFGTGEYYQLYKWFFSRVEIVALLDNDLRKQGTILDGITIRKPEEAIREAYDGIYLLSVYALEMRRQLLNLGVPSEKIFDWDQIYDTLRDCLPERKMIQLTPLKKPFDCWGEEKCIAVLEHEMEFSGSTIAVYEAVKILKKMYAAVVVVTMRDGPMVESFAQIGVPVFLDPFLWIVTLDDIPWVKKCSLLFLNTNLFCGFFRRNHTRLPILWWLHEPEMLYQGKFCEKINGCYSKNIHVYAVGEIPAEAFQKRCPHWPMVKILRLGIGDFRQEPKKKADDRLIFSVIGRIDPVKGQDIFIDAIHRLSDTVRKRCEFWMIGRDESERFVAEVKAQAEDIPEIKFVGMLDRCGIREVYREIDVLVCPSWEDSMPIVTMEAMMNCRPTIVSDHTGTAKFLRDGENGLVFAAGDAAMLAYKMEWLAERPRERKAMGQKARELYEEMFSLAAFEKDLCAVVDAALENA